MRICKRCQTEIYDDELKYCSHCGADLTKKENLSTMSAAHKELVDESKPLPYQEAKNRRRWVCALMQFLIGPTGASFFYLGQWARGLGWIAINIGIALIAFFLREPFILIAGVIINFAMGFGWIFKKDLVDAHDNDVI